MPAGELIERLTGAQRAYGEPFEKDGVTVITACDGDRLDGHGRRICGGDFDERCRGEDTQGENGDPHDPGGEHDGEGGERKAGNGHESGADRRRRAPRQRQLRDDEDGHPGDNAEQHPTDGPASSGLKLAQGHHQQQWQNHQIGVRREYPGDAETECGDCRPTQAKSSRCALEETIACFCDWFHVSNRHIK